MAHLEPVVDTVAPAVHLPQVVGRPDFARLLLLALADVESAGGVANVPRFERRWWSRLTDPANAVRYERFAPWLRTHGWAVASSWGPWQLLAFNAFDAGYSGAPYSLTQPEVAAVWTVRFLNSRPLAGHLVERAPGCPRLYHRPPEGDADRALAVDVRHLNHVKREDRLELLALVGDVWNTGNAEDDRVPTEYLGKLAAAYLKRETAVDDDEEDAT